MPTSTEPGQARRSALGIEQVPEVGDDVQPEEDDRAAGDVRFRARDAPQESADAAHRDAQRGEHQGEPEHEEQRSCDQTRTARAAR
jgi:hypothetical protein